MGIFFFFLRKKENEKRKPHPSRQHKKDVEEEAIVNTRIFKGPLQDLGDPRN